MEFLEASRIGSVCSKLRFLAMNAVENLVLYLPCYTLSIISMSPKQTILVLITSMQSGDFPHKQ